VQRGLRVKLLGYAQSNARVSTLMRNIEAFALAGAAELVEVKANSGKAARLGLRTEPLAQAHAIEAKARAGACKRRREEGISAMAFKLQCPRRRIQAHQLAGSGTCMSRPSFCARRHRGGDPGGGVLRRYASRRSRMLENAAIRRPS